MNRLTTATCPRCGAQVQPAPGSEQVTCSYCGTTSFLPRQPVTPASVGARAPNPMPWVLIGLGIGGFVLVSVAVCVFLLVGGGPSESVSVHAATPPVVAPTLTTSPALAASASVPLAAAIKIRNDFPPLVADVDADGRADVVVAIEASGAAPATEHYAAFDGRTGRELSRSAALGDGRSDTLPVVVGRRLVTASRSGQLTGYGLATGSQQWTTALGARVTAFCAAKSADALLVATDEGRQLEIDLTTGRQSETKAACSTVLARSNRGDDPRDRHDYSAPLGTESYHCGGVTVMGSANYTVADQCLVRAHIDTDHLDGLVGSRLWKTDQNWIVFGVRRPGSNVPMVGLVTRGRIAWKSEVPQDNPLDAQEGSPQNVGLAGSSIIATYSTEKVRRIFVTAFSVSDGTRRWNTPLPEGVKSLSSLSTSPERVFVLAQEQLFLLDAATGKSVAVIGRDQEH